MSTLNSVLVRSTKTGHMAKLFEKITESTNEHDDCKSFDPFSRFHEAGRRLPDGAGRRGADAALR